MYTIHPSLSDPTQDQGQHSHFYAELKLMTAHNGEGDEFGVIKEVLWVLLSKTFWYFLSMSKSKGISFV